MRQALEDALANRLHDRARSVAEVRAAQEEIAFAASLCDHPLNTLLALQRDFAGAEISEKFKVIRPPAGAAHEHIPLWGIDQHDADT